MQFPKEVNNELKKDKLNEQIYFNDVNISRVNTDEQDLHQEILIEEIQHSIE